MCHLNAIWRYVGMLILCCSLAQAQSTSAAPAVPHLVSYSGRALDAKGQVVSGIMGITLSIYKDQYEGAPLWSEIQNVTADAKGNYSVQLGSASSQGLPLDLFTSGEARWLGVRINSGEEQPRVLLLSVPYALKAADAQTLGGFPASAFALAQPQNASSTAVSRTPAIVNSAVTAALSGTGTKDYIPLWTSGTALGDSVLYQSGTKIGLNTKTPATALDVTGKVNASGGFDLGGKNFAFGSYTNGNAFLGFAGNTATTGAQNTAVGAAALNSPTTGNDNTAIGTYALYGNTSGHNNTASGAGALSGSTSGTYNTSVGFSSGIALDGSAFTGSYNTFLGAFSKPSTGSLSNATAIGAYAEVGESNALVLGSINGVNGATANTSVGIGTTIPAATLHLDLLDYGASDSLLLGNNSSKGLQLFDSGTGVDIGSIGVPLYINYAGLNTYLNVSGGRVGIGTAAPTSTLSVSGSADKTGGGSWGTYSDARLKTLHGAFSPGLSQILKINPVRYRYKEENALGIRDHEEHVGLVAQDVQKIIPEAVSETSNGYLLRKQRSDHLGDAERN